MTDPASIPEHVLAAFVASIDPGPGRISPPYEVAIAAALDALTEDEPILAEYLAVVLSRAKDTHMPDTASIPPIRLRCDVCRLLWEEDRSKGDSPMGPHAFLCPRCGECGAIIKP